ncbi:hypothetical protein SAMN05444173_2999 [Opitutus sp. GAS368]|nr:hypothetical protein SAMN05444173_2999 [Opitutus sp. GAS368]
MLLFLSSLGFTAAADLPPLQSRAREVLERALREESGFVRIHAAEALLDTGSGESVRAAFAGAGTGATAAGARIGTWRVLALASATAVERDEWIGRVRKVALDAAAGDRLQALETLGKLHVHLDRTELDAIRNFAIHATPAEAPLPWWVLHINGAPDALPRIVDGLSATDPVARLRAAYILKRDHLAGKSVSAALARAWSSEPAGSVAYPYLLCALAVLTERRELQQDYIDRLSRLLAEPTASGRSEISLTLMHLWPVENAGRLEIILAAKDADTRIGAAWAVLRLRATHLTENR